MFDIECFGSEGFDKQREILIRIGIYSQNGN